MSDTATQAQGQGRANRFAHLHCHTHFSLLDGASHIPELAAHVKSLGMTAAAITDHGNLHGAIEFYQEMKKAGLNPVVGYEAYVAPGGRRERGAARKKGAAADEQRGGRSAAAYHLTLLAKNRAGFKNLVKMATYAYTEGYYYVPRIDKELLAAHAEGVVCLSGCVSSEVSRHLLAGRRAEAEAATAWLARTFGRDFYVEVQNNGLRIQADQLALASEMAARMGLPLVATSDAHYLRREDARAHDLLLCINTGRRESDVTRMRYGEDGTAATVDQFYVCGPQEMYDRFAGHAFGADAVARSQEIADGIHLDLDLKTRHFPVYLTPRRPAPSPAPSGEDAPAPAVVVAAAAAPPSGLDGDRYTPEEYLEKLCRDALPLRYPPERYPDGPPADRLARLDYELGVIAKMGFAGYFLVVWDFVNFARGRGIQSGARGSAAGAIVSYLLFLSHIDPIEHGLLFERFLDPNRAEAPDIDMDFCQDRREEVLEYVRAKYGAESVAQIATFGTLAARAAIKDVAKALGLNEPGGDRTGDRLAALVPEKVGTTIDDALARVPELAAEYQGDPRVRAVIDLARRLEGTNRHAGVHAAGVVIAAGPLVEHVPLFLPKGKGDQKAVAAPTTQWSMGDLEKVGLLKMDFLGLRTLTLLDHCLRLVESRAGVRLDLQALPPGDRAAFDLLAAGDTLGVFQFDCLAGDTILNGGPRKTIEQMYREPPAALVSVDLGSGRRVRNQVLKVVATGRKQLHKLTTADGYLLRGTADHKVLTAAGWRRLGDLKPGDGVVVNTKDASRIGGCCDCRQQTKSRHRCHACANRLRDSGHTMLANRSYDKWFTSLLRGPEQPNWGSKPSPATQWYPGVPHAVRGHWEADFALVLIANGIAYEYEPRSFKLANGSAHTPDFHLTEQDVWVDIRNCGYTGAKKLKYEMFRREHPGLKAVIIRSHEIAEFELAHPKLAQWNCPALPPRFAFSAVVAVDADAVEETYDVMMAAPLNNYIANGIVVHNSGGIRDLLRRMRPDRIGDITAATALYRPGPLEGGMVDDYVERKHGRQAVPAIHPIMDEILADTYAVMVFQEQNMQILNRMGGIELARAYATIKAISKKKQDVIDANRADFVRGAVARGLPEVKAEEVFGLIQKFGGYGFNRAHSAAYADLSYKCAFLKAHFPECFAAALLSSDTGDRDTLVEHLEDTRRHGMTILPPDVNASQADFDCDVRADGGGCVRFGLAAVKGFGRAAAQAVVAGRAGGPYLDLADYLDRLAGEAAQAGHVELLVKAGAFDSLLPAGGHRAALVAALAATRKGRTKAAKSRKAGQLFLFDGQRPPAWSVPLPAVEPWSSSRELRHERDVLDIYLSSHPLAAHAAVVREFSSCDIADLTGHEPGKRVVVGGIVGEVRAMFLKSPRAGRPARYGRFKVEDQHGSVECVIWPDEWVAAERDVRDGAVVLVDATVERRRDITGLNARRAVLVAPPPGSDAGGLAGPEATDAAAGAGWWQLATGTALALEAWRDPAELDRLARALMALHDAAQVPAATAAQTPAQEGGDGLGAGGGRACRPVVLAFTDAAYRRLHMLLAERYWVPATAASAAALAAVVGADRVAPMGLRHGGRAWPVGHADGAGARAFDL